MREKIFIEIPRAGEIEKLLSRSGINAAKAVISGADTRTELKKLKEDNLKLQAELNDLLSLYGYFDKDLDIKFYCSDCKDTGYIDGKMCQCMKILLREIVYSELNSISPLKLSTFDSFDLSYYSNKRNQDGKIPRARLEKIFNFCCDYANNFTGKNPSILMEGGTGLGKTHLSLAIAKTVINKGFDVVYCSVPDILRKLEQEHFSKDSTLKTKESLESCDLLILDDLGTEFATKFTKAAVYNLINTRMMMSKPTIINTNLSLAEIQDLYSDRLVSRIIGEHVYLEFIGEDIRILKRINLKA